MSNLAEVKSIPNPRMTNLGKLLASSVCKSEYQYVRIRDKTANITNGSVLVRRYVDLPDGMYNITERGMLEDTVYPFGLSYPDVEPVKPDFKKIRASCRIPRDHMGLMMSFASQVFQKRGMIVIDASKIYNYYNEEMLVAYPFNLVSPIKVCPRNFGIVMTEMSQYESVAMLRDIPVGETKEVLRKIDGVKTPLIIGQSWGSCALMMPKAGYY